MTKGETSTPMREQNVTLQCPKLNESNYTTWAIMMETILKAYGLWETLEATEEEDGKEGGDGKKGGDGKEVDERKMHTTKALILTTLPEDILMQVAQCSNAKEVWESIKARYLGEDRVQKARLQTLRSELETLKMKNNETVNDFAGKLGSIRGKFKGLGSNLKDKVLVRKLLNSVPKKFLPIVASIEQYSEVEKMSFEEATGRIITFEERLKSQDEREEDYQSKLLMASSSNQSLGRGRGRNFSKGERGHGRGASRGEQSKKGLRCYECGEYGHFAYECTKWKEEDKRHIKCFKCNKFGHFKHGCTKEEEANLAQHEDVEPIIGTPLL